MKKIVFVENLEESKIEEISDILDETRASYSIDINNKAIILEGNNDIVHSCKVVLRENGYKVN